MVAETRLNPVDGPRVAVEARPHRQRDAPDCGRRVRRRHRRLARGHRAAVHRHRVGRVGLDVVAGAVARINEVRRQVNQSAIKPPGRRGQVGGADDVGALGHHRVEFTRLQRAVTGRVQHGTEAVRLEQCRHVGQVFGVERNNAVADELPRLRGPDADDLAGVALAEIEQGVVAGDPGDARDQERQTRRR